MPSPLTRLQAPRTARTASACRRAFEGQPLDGNPRLGDWRSATKSYPSGQGRNSVSDLGSEVRCSRTHFGTSLELLPASQCSPSTLGVRAAPAAAGRGPSREDVCVNLERLSLAPQNQRKPKRPKTNQPGATDTSVSVPVKTLGCRVTVLTAADSSGDSQRSAPMGCRPVLQLTTIRESRFPSTHLVASADDNAARVEQT
jgi:hypothetical protein